MRFRADMQIGRDRPPELRIKSLTFMKTALICFFLGLWVVVPSIAQPAGSGDKPPEARGRVAWFVYTSMPDGLENPVSVMTGKDVVSVTLSKRSPSDPVKIPADGMIRIVRKVENPDDPKKPLYITLAQAMIPEGVADALIILTPAVKNPNGWIFQSKVLDLAHFKGGNSLYLNMTHLQVRIDMGKSNMVIKPGVIKIHDDPSITVPTNVPISYSYYKPEKKQWKLLSSSTIVVYPTRREICIFSWDPRYDRIDYHGITFPVM